MKETIERVRITPEKALEMLSKNKINRPIKRSHVTFLANEILSGNWVVNGESIKFNNNDELIDGQHRLSAIIQANKPVTTLVTFGLKGDVFSTIDTGKSRSGGDILSLRGEKNANSLASLIYSIYKYYVKKSMTTSYKLSNTELEKMLELYPDTRNYAGKGPRVSFMPNSVVEFCWYVTGRIDKEQSDDFIDKLCTGEGLKKGDPILALRNKLVDAKVRGLNYDRTTVMMMVLKTWNHVRKGESRTRLVFKSNEAIPKVI